MTPTKEQRMHMHRAIWGGCCGYDLMAASTLTPQVVKKAKQVGVWAELCRMRKQYRQPERKAMGFQIRGQDTNEKETSP